MKSGPQKILPLVFIALLVPAHAYSQAQRHKKNDKPNIVFILTDDMGWKDLGAYGSTFYETPNIDRLASQGIQFMDAYASSPVCSPSRASIMTGQYPDRTGITDWTLGQQNTDGPQPDQRLMPKPFKFNLPKTEVTIAQALKRHGYVTFFAGKWHLGMSSRYWPEREGFDYNYGGWAAGSPVAWGMGGYFSPYHNPKLKDGPKGEFLTDRLTTETIKFIKGQVRKGKPFFVDLSFYAVHEPIQAKKKYIEKFREKADKMNLIDATAYIKDAPWMEEFPNFKERVIQSNPIYAALIYSVDENVGRIVKTLKHLGVYGNTIIVFTSDNGGLSTLAHAPTSNNPLRYGKGFTYEGGVRIPLIIDWPGVTKGGSISTFPVINTDLYPTFLQMAGLPLMPKQHEDGVSMVPLLRGKRAIDQPTLYWNYPHYHGGGAAPTAALRKENWKLIQYYGSHVELYDLRTDIEERRDLANAFPEKKGDLLGQLEQWEADIHAQIPSINPYYNPDPFRIYVKKHDIQSMGSRKLRPYLIKYQSKFKKDVFDPDLYKSYLRRYKKLYNVK